MAILLIVIGNYGYSFGKPDHSEISVQYTQKEENGKFVFKATPKGALVANFSSAPWSMKIRNSTNIEFIKKILDVGMLDKNLPGFHLSATLNNREDFSFDFDFVAFVCTKDKTKCYRDSHKRTCHWDKKNLNCSIRKKS